MRRRSWFYLGSLVLTLVLPCLEGFVDLIQTLIHIYLSGYVTQKNLSQPTGSHFTQAGHSLYDLTVQGIELVKPINDPFVLKTRETFWITKYNSTKHGNNSKK